jgi:hypothetical protein
MLKSEIRIPKSEIPQSGTKSECALARAGLIRISGFGLLLAALSRRRSGSDFGFHASDFNSL